MATFTPPNRSVARTTDADPVLVKKHPQRNALAAHFVGVPVSVNVYDLGSGYTEEEAVARAAGVTWPTYLAGHIYNVSDPEATRLTAAGYTVV